MFVQQISISIKWEMSMLVFNIEISHLFVSSSSGQDDFCQKYV